MLMVNTKNKISTYQLELLRSFKFIQKQHQLDEIKSLLTFYWEAKLDQAITEKENKENFTAEVYEKWLSNKSL
jgi:hypothetical protein